ncbi:hypothetical protein P3T17_001263 [Paraburkholderia sp. GAS82]
MNSFDLISLVLMAVGGAGFLGVTVGLIWEFSRRN